MKKTLMAAAAAATIALTISTAAFAAGGERVEANGIAFEIPEELAEKMTVKTDENDMLVSVYETASLEAAEALGVEGNDGAGWLFGISRLSEAEVDALRCGAMDGMEVFAEDDGYCLIFNHPTDVRVERENEEDFLEGLEEYSTLSQWAFENVREEILANNPELDPEEFTNTELDMYLARAAYQPDTNFEVRSLMFGDRDLPLIDAHDHLEELADEFVFRYADGEEAPDGEYFVLAFPDDDVDVRFDFFTAPGFETYVREVKTIDGEETETLYIGTAKDADDFDDTPFSVMNDWVEDILEGDD